MRIWWFNTHWCTRASFYTLQEKQRNISNAVHIFHLTHKNNIFREARSIAPLLPALSSAHRAATALFSMRKTRFWKNDSEAIEKLRSDHPRHCSTPLRIAVLVELVQAGQQSSAFQKGPADPRWKLMPGFPGSSQIHSSNHSPNFDLLISTSTVWVDTTFRGNTVYPQRGRRAVPAWCAFICCWNR